MLEAMVATFLATPTVDNVSLNGGDVADVDGDGNDEAYFVNVWNLGTTRR